MTPAARAPRRGHGDAWTELRRIALALAWLAAGFLLTRVAGLVPAAVDSIYGRRLFPRIAVWIGTPARAVPVSLVQMLLVFVVAGSVIGLIRSSRRAIARGSWTAGFGPPHLPLVIAAVIVWAFQLAWGCNYARPPLARRLQLPSVAAEPAQLSHLVRTLAREVNATRRLALEAKQYDAGSGPAVLRIDRQVVADRLSAGYEWLMPEFIGRHLSAPRHPRPLGWILTRIGISGFYFPFTGEATVNAELPAASVPFVQAHEMAHQRGIAREDEANFEAYVACRESGLAAARYSGALGAFGLAWNTLVQAAPDSAQALGPGLLEAGPRADRDAIRVFWTRHEGRATEAADRVNDAYLRANAQKEGTASYGRAVDLLLGYQAAGLLE